MIKDIKDKWLREHCNQLDADVFSGDALMDKDDLNNFKKLLTRWSKAVKEIEETQE